MLLFVFIVYFSTFFVPFFICRRGADHHAEAVLPSHLRAQPGLPDAEPKRQHAQADEHPDGAKEVLQPPLPDQRGGADRDGEP
jgi:hypothetical protein